MSIWIRFPAPSWPRSAVRGLFGLRFPSRRRIWFGSSEWHYNNNKKNNNKEREREREGWESSTHGIGEMSCVVRPPTKISDLSVRHVTNFFFCTEQTRHKFLTWRTNTSLIIDVLNFALSLIMHLKIILNLATWWFLTHCYLLTCGIWHVTN
jgi:hypothetical protein